MQAALLAQRTRDGGAYRLACLSARPLKSQLPPAQTVRRPPSSAPPSSRAHLKSAMMYTIHSWPRRNRTNIAQLPPPFILAPPRPENIGPIFILWRAGGWHARALRISSAAARGAPFRSQSAFIHIGATIRKTEIRRR